MYHGQCHLFLSIRPSRPILPRTLGYAPSGRSSAGQTSGLAPPVPGNTHNGFCPQPQLTGYCAGQWPPASPPAAPQRPWARACRGGWGRSDARRPCHTMMCCRKQLTAVVGTFPPWLRRLRPPRKRAAGGAPPRAWRAPVRATRPATTGGRQRLVGAGGQRCWCCRHRRGGGCDTT